ncbi:hypothetical protein GQ44DRAFT_556986, partial [Phaeosphaeriaceae sp. PMI808]
MFDTDRSGSLNIEELTSASKFLHAWHSIFERFNKTSENMSHIEFGESLTTFGYRLSEPFVRLLFDTYAISGEDQLSFEGYILACVSLKRGTDIFKKFDEDRDGYAT